VRWDWSGPVEAEDPACPAHFHFLSTRPDESDGIGRTAVVNRGSGWTARLSALLPGVAPAAKRDDRHLAGRWARYLRTDGSAMFPGSRGSANRRYAIGSIDK
jgi:hypothetical protein